MDPRGCARVLLSASVPGKTAILTAGLAWAAMCGCAGTQRTETGRQGAGANPVPVQIDHAAGESAYSVSRGPCRIEWSIRSVEAHLVHHRAECSLPVKEQMPLIESLMREVLEGSAGPERLRTLFWGRIYPDGEPDTTLAFRLALAAHRSPHWDSVRGRPENGDPNGFVRSLANEAMIYPELRDAFRSFGLEIRVMSVEKVLIQRAAALPFYDRLAPNGVRPADRLPIDGMTWFSISRISSERPYTGSARR